VRLQYPCSALLSAVPGRNANWAGAKDLAGMKDLAGAKEGCCSSCPAAAGLHWSPLERCSSLGTARLAWGRSKLLRAFVRQTEDCEVCKGREEPANHRC